MVKGISRQVIVVKGTDPKIFEQAIFIVREDAKEVTDAQLLKEAKRAVRGSGQSKKWHKWRAPLWVGAGAGAMGLLWGMCSLL